MAKTVQPIAIELGIKGGEKLAALNRSFRDLSKQVKLSDADITQATKDIVTFATKAGNSEATIKGQIKAFEGLREQAAMGGKAYVQLGKDIANLKSNLQGSTSAIDAKKKAILDLANSTGATSKQIQNAIDKLSALRAETKLDSTAFAAFGKDIEGLVAKLNLLDQQSEKAVKKAGLLAGGIRATPGGIRAQAQAFKGEAANIQLQIDGIDNLAGKERTLKKNVEERLRLQERLNKLLRSEAQAGFLASVESGRKVVISAADAFNDADVGINSFNKRLQLLDDIFGELPNTTAGFNQRLQELQKQLVNTIRDGGNYVSVALEIARVQREAAAATQDLGAALVKDLNTGVAARSSKNLREAIAQLQSEMNELDVQTAEGSILYAEKANQVRNLETELRKLGDSYRHVSDMAQQAAAAQGAYANTATARNYLNRAMVRAQEAAGAQVAEAVRAGVAATPLMLPAAGGTTAPGTGLQISGERARVGRDLSKIQRFFSRAEIGEAQIQVPGQPVGYGPQPTEAQADRSRRAAISEANAIRENTEAKEAARRAELNLRREIREAKGAYDGSINSINRLRSALENYRVTLPATSKRFQLLTRDLVELDRKSEEVSRRMGRRRGMSPMQMTQAAGAAISGGIFGGPEGFLGGAIGAIGGVGGAFAGAAIGAQVGGLRRQLGEFADYAAQIQKMQIALRGVAGSQVEFNRAMAAASSVTKELNVPQDVAIQGMTRLTAAVKGAGGGVADAELAFKNINSAIIATGGGAEQVEGAVTALVQIFSKGKVSAEEINQIAERLPGTFNKIAEASGRTGPELTKALQDGEVGLNDLMEFLVQLGGDYNALAEKIAQSSESAGARLRVAYDKMRQEVGKALQPIGAEFQAAFAEFIQDITPDLVSAAKAVGDGLRFVIQNKEAIAVAASFALKLAAVNLALKAFAAFNGPVSGMFALLRTGLKATSQQAALAQTRLAAFGKTVKALAVSLAAPIVITFAVVGAEMVIAYFNRIKQARADLEATARKPQGEVFFRSIGGTAATKQTLQRNINDITKNLDILRDRVKSTKKELQSLEDTARTTYGGGGGGLPVEGVTDKSREDLKTRLQADEAEIKRLVLNYKTLVDRYIAAPDAAAGLTDFPGPVTEEKGGAGGKKAARDAERIAQQLAQIKLQEDAIERSKALLEVNAEIRENARQIVFAQTENNTQKAYALRQDGVSLEFLKRDLEIQLDYQKAVEAAALEENAQIRAAQLQLAEKQRIFGIEENINDAISDRIGLVQENTIELKKQAEALGDARFGLREQLGLVDPKEAVAKAQERFKAQYPGATEADLDLIRQQIDPTPFEKVQQNIAQSKKELGELVKSANQITSAATAIGDAFSQSFTDAISGSKTAKEALADFFSSVGSYFLDMAKQIIAKMIQIAILNTFAKVLPSTNLTTSSGVGLSAGAATQSGFSMGSSLASMFANGGIMTEKGPLELNRYASGGIARGPQLAMFGEGRMPEAYVPLPDGRSIPVTMKGGKTSTNVVVNVDASGTSVQGDDRRGKELGNAISAAVQAELIKQQRPGGLLNR
jgi:tape measure domain-containing protein